MKDLQKRIAELSPKKRELLRRRLQEKATLSSQIHCQSRDSNEFPLSFAQQRLWFLHQLDPCSPAYKIPAVLKLEGHLHIPTLAWSLNQIIRRHELLRTTFELRREQPVQVIAPQHSIALPIVDLSSLTELFKQQEIERLASAAARQSFDLTQGPLLQGIVMRLAPKAHILSLTMHHLVSDGWSIGILLQEIATFYETAMEGRSPSLPDLPIQYADFAVWQRQWLQGERLEEQLTYWQDQLGHTVPHFSLPTDYPRPAQQSFRGAQISKILTSSLTRSLKDLSQQQNCTLFMTLLAAFQILLFRYTHQREIIIGTPIAGRNRAETQPLIGFFVNTLVLRVDLGSDLTFKQVLSHAKESTLGALAHQDLPFEKLVEALQPERDLSRNPLFQIWFALHNTPMPELKLPDLDVSFLSMDYQAAQLDLSLDMTEIEGKLICVVEYNTDLFKPATIHHLLDHFQILLEGISLNLDQRISNFPILTQTEQQYLLALNPDPSEVPIFSLPQQFGIQAAQNPHSIAVVYQDHYLTYEELDQRSNQLAHYLHRLGVGPDLLVGIHLEPSLEMVIGLLGILKAGGAYLPLDPSYPTERLSWILRDSQVPMLITDRNLDLPECEAYIIDLIEENGIISQESLEGLNILIQSESLAYVIYTSGSTGRPKGVQIPHRALNNLVYQMSQHPGLTSDDVLLSVTTLAFDIATLEIFLPLILGARLVLVPRSTAMDGIQLSDELKQFDITVMQATPATWKMLLTSGWQGDPNLKVLCGGEALPDPLAQTLRQYCGSLWNMYGPTETTIWSAVFPIETSVAIGPPIGNTQFYVLDPDQNLVPPGLTGELYIGGSGVARGYVNRPDLTAERFIPDLWSADPGQRMYRTGDRVRFREDGTLKFLGRIDHQIKLRGYRIELGEIELIINQHPHISQAVVIRIQEDNDDPHLAAFVVANEQETNAISSLRDHLQCQLPAFMVPSRIHFLDQLPLTPNGKIDRVGLAQGKFQGEWITIGSHTPQAPRTLTEEKVCGIWAEILGLDQVGIRDNFFDLGGHSLQATQVIARLQTVLGVEISIRSFFESPTVETLAEQIEQNLHELRLTEPIPVVSRDHPLPLSPAQQRLWFLEQLQPDHAAYGISMAVRLRGDLDIEVLRDCLSQLVQRHETLRTWFRDSEQGPIQIIESDTVIPLQYVDLKSWLEGTINQEIENRAVQEALRPFNLQSCPLLRITLIEITEQHFVALLTMHHIISDGWSMGVLIEELITLYQAGVKGNLPTLPDLPIQYADFAVWHRRWLQEDKIQPQLEYWYHHLKDAPSQLKLPLDRPRSQHYSSAASRHPLHFSLDLRENLRSLGQQQGATLFMVLLSAFAVLLHHYSLQQDLVIGSPIANRQRPETERVIGFFVNTLALRIDLSQDPTVVELIRRVRSVCLGAYAHPDLPFERLVEVLQVERDPTYHPLFQTWFVLQPSLVNVEVPRLSLESIRISRGAARHDLKLDLSETQMGLEGFIEYKTELFEANTIAHMADLFQHLVETMISQPEVLLSELNQSLEETSKRRQRSLQNTWQQSRRRKLGQIRKRRAVQISSDALIRTDEYHSGSKLPMLIQPVVEGLDLTEWAQANREWIRTQLIRHGGLLLREFSVEKAVDLERVMRAISEELMDYTYGSTPRSQVKGKVYTSTEYPPDQHIPLHNEMAYARSWPNLIGFCCLIPASQGGQTPIADSRRIFDRLDPAIRDPFLEKGVMYVRNYGPALDLSWKTVFQTEDPATVETYCRMEGIEVEWLSSERLRTRQICQASLTHPQTGDQVWFNQAHLFHTSNLMGEARQSLLSIVKEEDLPRQAYYGDGTSIEPEVLDHIRTVMEQEAIEIDWHKGDLLLLDNVLSAHGRRPFSGNRRVVVVMSEPMHEKRRV